jgi:hypothetical protein
VNSSFILLLLLKLYYIGPRKAVVVVVVDFGLWCDDEDLDEAVSFAIAAIIFPFFAHVPPPPHYPSTESDHQSL